MHRGDVNDRLRPSGGDPEENYFNTGNSDPPEGVDHVLGDLECRELEYRELHPDSPPRAPLWRRSRKGNCYCRLPDGSIATVFKKRGGRYCWVVFEDGKAKYSALNYSTESHCCDALTEMLF